MAISELNLRCLLPVITRSLKESPVGHFDCPEPLEEVWVFIMKLEEIALSNDRLITDINQLVFNSCQIKKTCKNLWEILSS